MSDSAKLEIVLAATDITSKAFSSVKSGIGGLKNAVFSLQGAMTGLGIGVAAKELFDAGVKSEKLDRAFTAIAGTSTLAKTEFNFLRKESNALGLEFWNTAESYKGVFAASKDTNLEGQKTRDIFVGITGAAVALGLSQDDLSGILNAVSQMMSKGKVSMEELRQQLGERLPGAFQIAADSMGMSTSKLDKMVSSGKILAEDLLPAMARGLTEKYGKAAVDSSNSAQAAINRFNTAWTDMTVDLAKSGFMDVAVNTLKDLTADLSEMGKWIKENNQEVTDFFKTLGITIKGLGQLGIWTGSLVGWLPGWASDLGAAFGMAASGAINLADVATANREELRNIVKSFDINPLLMQLQTQKEQLEIEMGGLKDQLNISDFTKKMFSIFEPNYIPTLDKLFKEKLAELARVNDLISQEFAPKNKPSSYAGGKTEPPPPHKPPPPKELTAEQEKALKDRLKIVADFNDQYTKMGKTTFDIERMNLKAQVKVWENAHLDKKKIHELAESEMTRISNNENQKKNETLLKFNDEYRKMGKTTFELERMDLAENVKAWTAADADKKKIKTRTDYESTRIANEESAKRNESLLEFTKEYQQMTMSSFDLELMEIEERGRKYIKDGADEIEVAEWVSGQIAQINAKEKEERLRNSREWRDGATRALNDYVDNATNMAAGVEGAFSNAFGGMEDALVKFVTTGKLSFTDMANSIIADMVRIAVRQSITGPLMSALAAGMSSVFGSPYSGSSLGSVGSVSMPNSATLGPILEAHGDIFGQSGIHRFANGGVFSNKIYDQPTPFLFGAGGSFGVMGEAGSEAVVPLTRTKSGDLGIRSEGGATPVINVIINNQASGASGRVESTSRNAGGGMDISVIIEQIDGAMAAGISTGRSALSGALESQYGMNRAFGVRR